MWRGFALACKVWDNIVDDPQLTMEVSDFFDIEMEHLKSIFGTCVPIRVSKMHMANP